MSQPSLFVEPTPAARISACGRYRYELHRQWSANPPNRGAVAFVMLNPSTADATTDDPTIRKCCGFARNWGYGAIRVVNLFALRATDPRFLRRVTWQEAIGPENDAAIASALEAAKSDQAPVIAAWGAFKHDDIDQRESVVIDAAERLAVPLWCIGTSQDGSPRHPLMVKYAEPRAVWP